MTTRETIMTYIRNGHDIEGHVRELFRQIDRREEIIERLTAELEKERTRDYGAELDEMTKRLESARYKMLDAYETMGYAIEKMEGK
jgi:DNA-binding transcriptional regulator GbsR (MarR family)